jgi:hypothetical protein
VNARRRMMPLAAIALAQLAWGRPPLAAPKADVWTPERVRTFVVKVESEMENLARTESESRRAKNGWGPPLYKTCCGGTPESRIKKSVARLRGYLEDEAAACYFSTYLGGQGPDRKPFNRSKVTIVEQTADRVVADVTELWFEQYFDGEAKWYIGEDHVEPFTEAEIAAVTDSSRYTITRGKDRVWRISDRKPIFRSTDVRDGTPPKVIRR